jgi:YceI-like protein
MNLATLRALAAAWICLGLPASPGSAAQMTHFVPVKGKVRIEGTSNIDSWQVESKSVTGFLEAGPDLAGNGAQTPALGPVEGRGEVSIEARSLKSIEKDGKPFSNKMDEIMYDALRSRENPKIIFRLNRLVLKVATRVSSGPSEYEAQGQLLVAGVAQDTTLRVNRQQLPGNQVRIWGTASLRMTDFRVEPPSPTIALGLIKTADEVKVFYEWVLAQQR